MDIQHEYDAKIQAAMSERDFRKREILFAEAERLRKQLSQQENNNHDR